MSFESEAITDSIRVRVVARYVPERSRPDEDQWFFAYSIRISNEGTAPVQLMSRHWFITDADGRVEEVSGPGVIGEQPFLQPGESFQYASACPLTTPMGTMHGSYRMSRADGSTFDVRVAPFTLSEPYAIN